MMLDTADVIKLNAENGTIKAASQMDTSQYFGTLGLAAYAFRLAAVTGLSLAASLPSADKRFAAVPSSHSVPLAILASRM